MTGDEGMRPVRIANCSGFFGDRLSAAAELLHGPERIDALTGDWLAELTIAILTKSRSRGRPGYATSFLTQMEQVLGQCRDQNVRVVSNAGGIEPHACADRVAKLAERLGIGLTVAVVDGDDLTDRLGELHDAAERFVHLDTGEPWAGDFAHVVSAVAYLGGHGITAALRADADIVITGRIADAALVSGTAAWWHGWRTDDFDALAGATAAGHAIECGTQVTGGNYAFFGEIPDLTVPGFPIAEVGADGTSVITKMPGTEGAVTVGTVTAQLLYEIAGPRYVVPDVVARFDTAFLRQVGTDRVEISGVIGEPAPSRAKALLTYSGGYRNSMTFAITGTDREAKARLAQDAVWAQLGGGPARFAESRVEVVGAALDSCCPDDQSYLRVSVADCDRALVGRAFSAAAVATALGSYPGLYLTTPPTEATEFMVGWPTLIDSSHVHPRVRIGECELAVPAPSHTCAPSTDELYAAEQLTLVQTDKRHTREVDLGSYIGARSGDKGGNANLGLWVTDPRHYDLLRYLCTPQRICELLPEARSFEVRVFLLPNLLAANIVIVGFLGHGVAASLREDPQAKSLGERFRAVRAAVPTHLISDRVPRG